MSSSSPDTLSRDILRGLTDGQFVPGQRLAERDLMIRYSVGRSTVREALSRLASMGFLEIVPHRGATIRRLTRREAADVLRVAAVLIGLTARQAAEAVAAGADPAPMREALAVYVAAARADLSRARARYYRAMTALAGNRELERLVPAVQVPLVRAQIGEYETSSGGGHEALAGAISAGEGDQAEAIAHQMIRTLADRLPGLPDSLFTRS
ncbi:GntR family transcriptional regulator [Falsigemmobacter faecalis]|uniref:GntR family transcriptional regulator n=1 Tax=Falsigemmobacter faecalis TaxID=2488730 RepID=A0A3P3DW95_9RHOB|nr:GntR family transcriptional regulator [Falsigemmobacter faecalis]RRH78401.1 GntR family transcriptional regulator [Falsigemmobacter faecalis]